MKYKDEAKLNNNKTGHTNKSKNNFKNCWNLCELTLLFTNCACTPLLNSDTNNNKSIFCNTIKSNSYELIKQVVDINLNRTFF